MSSAAVINATQSSGLTAGSPVTIATDGTVTPKLYGTGTGAWSVTANFAPVVGGVIGNPISLTIDSNNPNAVGASTRTDATQWVGWITAQTGIWQASGIIEGITGPDAQSGFLGTFAVGALPKYAVEAGSVAMEGGALVSYGGAGVGWVAVGALTYTTLALLLAATGVAGQSAKCTDPMFGPMGAMFDWAQSLGRWVPRNARIYGTGVGATYAASAGDINTDVQVATLAIPDSLMFAGMMATVRGEVKRNLSAGTTCTAKITNNSLQIAQVNVTLGNRAYFQGFVKCAIDTGTVTRSGSGTTGHGYGGVTAGDLVASGGNYTLSATLLATTAGMSQAFTSLYAELCYEGAAS